MTSKAASTSKPTASLVTLLLSGAWYFLAAILVLAVCMTAAFAFVGVPGGGNGELGIPVSFSVDNAHPVTSAALGIDNARIRNVRGTLIFPPGRGVPLVAIGLLLVGALGVVLYVMSELRALLRTVRDGHAFDPANAGRVTRIAWIVILAEPLRSAILYVAHSYAMRNFSSPDLHFDARVDFNIGAILGGLIILVLAEVFRTGTKLDEDQSLTI